MNDKIIVAAKRFLLDETLEQLFEVNKKCETYKSELGFPENDARTTIFTLMSMNVNYLIMTLYLSKELMSVEFYAKNGLKTEHIDKQYLANSRFNYISLASNAFFINVFMDFENYIRITGNAVGSNKYHLNKIISDIVHVCGLSPGTLTLYSIISNLRNTMHTGGIFNGSNEELQYNNVTYKFENDKPIMHGSIEDYIFYLNEILTTIIYPVAIATKETESIPHNYSNLHFEHLKEE